MLHILKNVSNRYNHYMTNLGRQRARDVLLQSSDRLLQDTGISRELLEQGVSAWPWKASEVATPSQSIAYGQSPAHTQSQTKQAIRELTAYSDSDLHDLGITRGTINEAVQFGRDGIERHEERKVA